MSNFQWLPVLKKLQGKRGDIDGAFGFIEPGIWVESYDGMIYAFTDQITPRADGFKTRYEISLKHAKEIYRSEREEYQPSLF